MSSDESSELSSVPSEDESNLEFVKKDGILKFFSKAVPTTTASRPASPPPPEREPSPPHEYVLADNPDIAFVVMFRSRFNEAFSKSLPNFGPQELERDVVDSVPGEHAEQFLCAVLGLLLNRKQDVKPGHYNRALEEAVQTHKAQWAKDWESKNPLSGGATFTTMTPAQRLTLLRTLTLWSLSSSDVVKGVITANYKQSRQEDDLNQPLSVQPWGSDSYRRRYYLIEGLDDTHFRIYRESSHTGIKRTWWSVAGDIEELKVLAEKLAKADSGQKARVLSEKMMQAIPRFEATEEKRKRREYRQMRKQQFKRPEPNFSMYEGRTRGKRIKYTYSDEEDEGFSDTTSRRSTRNTGTHTPAEPSGPTVTQSGRQVRSRHGGTYGESLLSGTYTSALTLGGLDGGNDELDGDDEMLERRPRRAAASNVKNGYSSKRRHIEGYNSVDDMDDEDDASEQDYGDYEEDDHVSLESDAEDEDDLEDEDLENDILDNDPNPKSLVIKLSLKTPTPEKSATRRSITPEKKSATIFRSNADSSAVSQNVKQTSPVATVSESLSAAPDRAVQVQSKPLPDVQFSKSADVLQQSKGNRTLPSPLSPSLAFRGSPEKAVAFPTTVNVNDGTTAHDFKLTFLS